ncbi:MAG: hypothetical protein AAGG38_02695 [Planctomycetota bacterium]
MAKGAKVGSVQELVDFRAFLIKFAEGVQQGVAAADSEMQSVTRWLGDEHPKRLSAEKLKADRRFEAAGDDLRRKMLQPTATGDPASTVTEKKALAVAKAKREWLVEKLAATKRWSRLFDKESMQYLSAVQSARAVPDSVVPRALGRLEKHLRAIEEYLEAQSPSAAQTPSAKMARSGRLGDASSEPSDDPPEASV